MICTLEGALQVYICQLYLLTGWPENLLRSAAYTAYKDAAKDAKGAPGASASLRPMVLARAGR